MSQSGQNKTQQLLNKAVNDLQHGELALAERGFKQVIKKHPNLSGVHYNLGYIYHARSDFKRAETSYKRAVELDENNANGWLNLGNVQLQQNHYKLAERSFKKALGLGLEQAGLYNSLATALDYQNKSEEAEGLFRQAIELRSPTGQTPEEAQSFARLNLAKLMHKQQRFRDSITLLEKFVSDAVDNIDGWLALGTALQECGEFDAAYQHYQAAIQQFPENARLRDLLGGVCIHLEKLDEAEIQFRNTLELDEKNFSAMNNLGLTLSAMGRREDAEKWFRHALTVRPTMGDAWRNLAVLKKFKHEDEDVLSIRKTLKKKSLDDYERMHCSFALGKALDDLGSYDEAFANYRTGNDLKKQLTPFRMQAYVSHVDRIINTFDEAFFAHIRPLQQTPPFQTEPQTDPHTKHPQPIFIVGMPRSGTTLVEQVLASHTKVFGAGELMTIGSLIRSIENNTGAKQSAAYPECVTALAGQPCMQLGTQYLAEIQTRFDTSNAERVTDKMPFNFIHLGFIATILPQAKIIHCQRQPLDVCLSNYFQYFISGCEFSYELETLGQYYLQYTRLMQHWQQVLPIPIHHVHYDNMISATETTVKDLLRFCELEWEPACLDFHQTTRPVRTSSSWQVRQPVYGRSLNRWKNYATQLAPLRDVLEGAGLVPAVTY